MMDCYLVTSNNSWTAKLSSVVSDCLNAEIEPLRFRIMRRISAASDLYQYVDLPGKRMQSNSVIMLTSLTQLNKCVLERICSRTEGDGSHVKEWQETQASCTPCNNVKMNTRAEQPDSPSREAIGLIETALCQAVQMGKQHRHWLAQLTQRTSTLRKCLAALASVHEKHPGQQHSGLSDLDAPVVILIQGSCDESDSHCLVIMIMLDP
jgi:hypothetical protein